MGVSKIDRFLSEATAPDQDGDASLRKDQLYGLYTSWCMLNQCIPAAAGEFWSEMKTRRIRSTDSRLRMTGAAAADYILATRPALV
ncbi:hypothetical protein Arth_3175 [Arthrobacter sp. FB24]|uniref:hypothetical protein n=1 Tax=Arthrobacter sp. (strain FB24) TaxID=290399 RepID=UPI0000526969|nr:hypothetical protein [Arthrobacter sp. FB24]ABK04553.1 hypothetical protein Arth_3175 [Arthrobacter sp. FB24]